MKYIFLSVFLLIALYSCNNSTTGEPTVAASSVQPVDTTQAEAIEPEPVPVPSVSGATSVLPSFRMANANNQIIDLLQFKGKKVFVNLWATWCPPCRAEIPSIESLGAKVDKTKAEFVMLSLDENFEKAKNYSVSNNMKLPVYYPAANLPPLFTVDGIPVTYIFNEKGEIIYQQVGSANYDTKEFADMMNK